MPFLGPRRSAIPHWDPDHWHGCVADVAVATVARYESIVRRQRSFCIIMQFSLRAATRESNWDHHRVLVDPLRLDIDIIVLFWLWPGGLAHDF